LNFMADFQLKMSVCRHELGGGSTHSNPVQGLRLSPHKKFLAPPLQVTMEIVSLTSATVY